MSTQNKIKVGGMYRVAIGFMFAYADETVHINTGAVMFCKSGPLPDDEQTKPYHFAVKHKTSKTPEVIEVCIMGETFQKSLEDKAVVDCTDELWRVDLDRSKLDPVTLVDFKVGYFETEEEANASCAKAREGCTAFPAEAIVVVAPKVPSTADKYKVEGEFTIDRPTYTRAELIEFYNIHQCVENITADFFTAGDILRNPMSAAMMGYAFPTGTGLLFAKFMINVYNLLMRIPLKTLPKEKRDYTLHTQLRGELAQPIVRLMNLLLQDDLGIKEGFTCIRDYSQAFEALEPRWKEISAALIKDLPRKPTKEEIEAAPVEITEPKEAADGVGDPQA